MAKKEPTDFSSQIEFKSLELLDTSFHLHPGLNNAPIDYSYKINVENRISIEEKLIFIIVRVEVKNNDRSKMYGALSVSCIFSINNFDEFVKLEADSRLEVPRELLYTLHSLSISTMRGIMFSTFRGTLLHNAVLPVINPRQLKQFQ